MITDDEMDHVFQALAHATRRTILDLLRHKPGQGVGELAAHFDTSRIAVMNHLAVLEKAGLVTSQKEGRTRRLYLNAVPIRMIQERWSDEFSDHWAGRLTGIKHLAEQAARGKGETE